MSISVFTQPVGASATATSDLLDILSELTEVSLVSANVNDSAELRDHHTVVEVSDAGTGTSIPVAGVRFLVNQIRMCRVIYGRDEDIVWFFGATSYLLPILFARLLGKTVVLQPRGDVPLTLRLHWERRVPDFLARFLADTVGTLEGVGYRVADVIVTYTPSMAAELGLDRYEEKLSPNGARYVDTDQFYPRTPYEERGRVIGFLGRLDEEKRIRELAEVAKRLSGDVTFVFAGDGPLRGWLETELAEEIETGQVEVTGWVDHEEVPVTLSRFRLLVLPSQPTEGLPTVILEAFACGTPVYATSVSGIPDVIQEGETGFLMNDVAGGTVVTELEEILARENLDEIGWNARDLIREEYRFEAAVERYRNILQRITP